MKGFLTNEFMPPPTLKIGQVIPNLFRNNIVIYYKKAAFD